MVFGDDLPALYHAFHDRFNDSKKSQILIRCQVCCLSGVPSHSKTSTVCEMCFDDDFWDKMEEIEKEKTDMLWVIKAIEGGMAVGSYFATGQYLGAGSYVISVDSLGQAKFFQTKDYAEMSMTNIQDTEKLTTKGGKLQLPVFRTVQVRLTEIG